MLKYLKWLDDRIIEYLSFFLLVFIPLYPKIPLADVLPGYIVRIRLDDVFVGITFAVWLIWLLRKKVTIKGNPLLIPIAVYLAIGLLSSLSAIFWTKTVPLQEVHLVKLFLHFARRIEYFSIFFIFFSSLKSFEQVKKYIYLTSVVFLLVSIYGFGQKYLYWPAFSTMNREFSKGITLYLTQNARVLSTFGGHYDLAAYAMLLLTLTIPLVFTVKRVFQKIFFLVVSLTGFWLLILTVSRTSFLAYLVSITVVFAALSFKKGAIWAGTRWFFVIFISLGIMLSFGDLSDRFAHVLKIDGLKSLALKPLLGEPPKGSNIAYIDVGSKSDVPPSTERPGVQTARPADVTVDIPEDGNNLPASMTARPRIYSQNAVNYDLSTGIRLDYTWPKAIEGFTRNPLLGSGYSTLTKQHIDDFSEAESTDNDFLRALGETGLLGFLSFYGIVGVVCYQIIKNYRKIKDPLAVTIVVGVLGGIVGLLVNAFYIDVFVSSKVAYTFWILVAIVLTIVKLSPGKSSSEKN